jgi:AraC-like DNA-binding protein
MPETTTLLHKLQHLHATRSPAATWHAPEMSVHVGLDTETVPANYYWDGLKRGGDAAHPVLVFQVTLAGWGCFAAGGAVQRVTPGKAFLAVVPSAHAYYLPPESDGWTFFYLYIRHPYVAARVRETQRRAGPVMALAENEMLLARAVKIFEGITAASFRDEWALEQALFDFLIEYERFAQRLLYPEEERQTMLDEARRYVLGRTGGRVEVDELARQAGMSRSHYSHRFKAVTGLAPAQWVTQVCLEEASRLLLATDHTLEAIAHEAGFANANHLCKVFRRSFHLSPGAFRRQMR